MSFFKTLFGGKEESPEEKARAQEAQDFDKLKYGGVRALKVGQVDVAVQCFLQALEIKDDLEIRDHLSVAYIHKNELQQAFAQLEMLAKAEPRNQEIWLRMARVAYMMEDYHTMDDLCQRALSVDENNPEAYCLRARAFIGQNQLEKAIGMLTEAIVRNDNYGEAYLLRGDTYLRMGNAEKADEDVTHLLKHVEDNEDVLLLKARVERKKGNDDEALYYYNKVVDANPFSLPAYQERALVKLAAGDKAGAEEDFLKYKELDEDTPTDISVEGIEQKVLQKYRDVDPYGIFTN
ncbi:MAG: tetratricopeptide repeat protein [Prevotella sp.]|nr:tetratricopeptide repeat protein [Prevotella sp.]